MIWLASVRSASLERSCQHGGEEGDGVFGGLEEESSVWGAHSYHWMTVAVPLPICRSDRKGKIMVTAKQ